MSLGTCENGLPKSKRFITGHNDKGLAIFSDKLDEAQPWQEILKGQANFSLCYTTSKFPVSFKDDEDIKNYEGYLAKSPDLVIPGGSVLRIVDFGPGSGEKKPFMHRTISIDYGIVTEGEVTLTLDSGEAKVMKKGDIAIQRGTNHAWKNNSQIEWARVVFILLEAEPVEINGEKLPDFRTPHEVNEHM